MNIFSDVGLRFFGFLRARVLARRAFVAALLLLAIVVFTAQAAPPQNVRNVSRAAATEKTTARVQTSLSRQDAAEAEKTAWRVSLAAQTLALVLGLVWVARAERLERKRAHDASLSPGLSGRSFAALRWSISLALLAAFSLPIVALWLQARGGEYSHFVPVQIATAISLATLALLAGRFRARGSGDFALFLCAGAGVLTLSFLVLCDALSRYPLLAGRLPTWLARPGCWQPEAVSIGAGSWQDELFASRLGASGAGFFVALVLICGVAAVIAAPMSRRVLFDKPPLEVRHTHPLSTAWNDETRAQIRLLEWCGIAALFLALRPLGNAPLPAIALISATAVLLWGWRGRVLNVRRAMGALLGALVGAALLLLFWRASAQWDGAFRGADSRREYSRSTPQRLIQNTASLAATTRRHEYAREQSGAQRAAALQVDTLSSSGQRREYSRASSSLESPRNVAVSRRTLPHRFSLDDNAMRAALIVWLLVAGTLPLLLRHPPPILWRVLGYAPAWGWMLLGGVFAAPITLLSHGAAAFFALVATLGCAFVFIWVEGA